MLLRAEDGQPRAAVIVLAYRETELLQRCLQSLAAHRSRFPFDVLVVANGVTPEVEAVLRHAGVAVVWSRANRGFAAGCNLGASHSRSEYLVLLNDDAEPEPGWLDALICAADAHPDVGAVGSLVLFPDGTVQEAGGVVWREGQTALIGRGADSDDPHLQTAGLVDYASACALLVRRQAWVEAGGMDECYYPAYYEDVDLCLSLRSRGWRIWLEPAARVRHAESASTDPATKALAMARNEARFQHKWREVLDRQPSHSGKPDQNLATAVAAGRRGPRRVLIVDDRAPAPGLGGGFGRMWDIVESLSRRGVQLTLVATVDATGNSHLDRLGVRVASDPGRWLNDPDNLVEVAVVSRPNNAHLVDLIRASQPWATVLYDAEALFHRRLERELEFVDDERQAVIGQQLQPIKAVEASLRSRFDGIVAISPEERDWLASQPGDAPVSLIEPLVPPRFVSRQTFETRRGAVFVAGWIAGSDSPNGDGLCWFARNVLPLVRSRLPGCLVLVTGDAPTVLRRFESASLRFTGHVPDLDALYASVRVAIAPIRFGSGVKIKSVEALLRGVPVVGTRHSAEGVPDDLLMGARITDDPVDFADNLFELLTDKPAWTDAHMHLMEAMQPDHPNRAVQLSDRWLDVLDSVRILKGVPS